MKKRTKKTKQKKSRVPKPRQSLLSKYKEKIQSLEKLRRRFSLLLKYGNQASTTTDLGDLLALLVEETQLVLNAERATVFLVDLENQQLWSKVAAGTRTIKIPLNKGIAGSVAMTGRLMNIPNVYKDSRFNPDIDKKTGYRTRNMLAAPMKNLKKEVIGVFQVLNRKAKGKFDKQDEELLTLLAEQAAGYVENTQLYHQIRKTAQETIIRLAGAVEFKDHDTRAHLWRMGQYSAIIAKQMGFGTEWIENIRLAAPMHDIGKIGVPDAILNKPGKLDPQEWEEMKKHPIYGAEILKDSTNELMQMSATIALCHHERWDGKGYPRGIAGEDIPIEARIASLADVFDALTSKRVYKPSFGLEQTLKMVDEETGGLFDPKVVKAFYKCLDEITPIMEKYAPKTDDKEPAKLPDTF